MAKEKSWGGTRKGAGRPSKARQNDLSGAMEKAFKKVIKLLPKDKRDQFKALSKDGTFDGDGREAVLAVLWEISLGMHSYADPESEMGIQDLKKRFEATKELSRMYYGPSPEGIAGTQQNALEIKDISELVSFKKAEDNKEE